MAIDNEELMTLNKNLKRIGDILERLDRDTALFRLQLIAEIRKHH